MSLILSRTYQETIIIYPYPEGDDRNITITVERIDGGQVKLSFEAPESVDIWRGELLEPEISPSLEKHKMANDTQ